MQLIHDECTHLHQSVSMPPQLPQVPIRRVRYHRSAESGPLP